MKTIAITPTRATYNEDDLQNVLWFLESNQYDNDF